MELAKKLILMTLAGLLPLAAVGEVRPADPQDEAAVLREELAHKMAQIDARHRELMSRMEAVEVQRRELELLMHRVADLDQYRAGADPSGRVAIDTTAVGEEQQQELEEQQQQLPDLPRISQEIGGVLTPKGRLVIEPSVQYIQSSVNRFNLDGTGILPAVLIGNIDQRDVDRDTYIGALTARFGLTSRLEAELKGSYVWRDDETQTRALLQDTIQEEVFNASGNDFGDVELGLRYQFNRGVGWPFLVGNLRIKSDTGTDPFDIATKESQNGTPSFSGELATGSGFWSINPSMTFIYPTDPVAFFGNVGYLWTIEDDKGTYIAQDGNGNDVVAGFGDVDPGDAWRFNFGMGVGLNDQSSFSISYQLDFFDETKIENQPNSKVIGSDATIGKLIVGYSIRLPGGAPLNLAIGVGATDDAPDTDVTVRMPFNLLQ